MDLTEKEQGTEDLKAVQGTASIPDPQNAPEEEQPVVGNDLWIWERLLTRINKTLDILETRLDENVLIHHEIRAYIIIFQRFRQEALLQPPEPLHVVIRKAINRLDELTNRMADYSREFYFVRRKLGLLEERVQRDKDEASGNDPRENAVRIALEFMAHVDDILNRIFNWDEDDEEEAAQQ